MIILHSFMYEHSFKSTKGRVKVVLTVISLQGQVIVPHSLNVLTEHHPAS